MSTDLCPPYAPFFSAMGVVSAIVFSSFGAAYGTAKSSVGCMSAGVIRPDLGVRAILPTVFSGILAIYGLVCSVLVANKIATTLSLYTSRINLGSGLAVGLCSLAAGFTIGIAGDAGVRSITQQPRLFVTVSESTGTSPTPTLTGYLENTVFLFGWWQICLSEENYALDTC